MPLCPAQPPNFQNVELSSGLIADLSTPTQPPTFQNVELFTDLIADLSPLSDLFVHNFK